ncbi:MAG: hypothetical protein GWP91_08630, partial [Rhodobacterales bacterium]|nr:hypothetical protein [Rhodobacterales bacterium]
MSRVVMGLTAVVLCGLAEPAEAGVVINEVLADPGGLDANCDGAQSNTQDEFLELVNTGPGAVDLTGYELHDSISARHVFGSLTLQPYDAVVVFGSGTPAFDGTSLSTDPWCVVVPASVTVLASSTGSLSLNNSNETVTLQTSLGVVVDTMTYASSPNATSDTRDPLYTGPFVDHDTVYPGAISPGTDGDGGVFGPPVIDTGSTTATTDTGTLTTDTGTVTTGTTPLAQVVINEFTADVSGSDGGYEWVELMNIGSTSVQMSGFSIERATTASWSSRYTLGPLMLSPGQRVVIGGEFVVANQNLAPGDTFGFGNASSSGDGLRLVDNLSRVVDTVIYGPNNTDLFDDDNGALAAAVAMHAADGSLARIPDGVDTQDSSVDFTELALPTPGGENLFLIDTSDTGTITFPTTCLPAGDFPGVVINEFKADPTLLPDTEGEWIELYNPGAGTADLSGWHIASGTSSYSAVAVLPTGTVLSAGGFAVVGRTAIAEATVVAPGFSLGNAGTSSDAVRLEDCNGTVVDTVIYGQPNTDLWADDGAAEAVSLAPKPTAGTTLIRVSDGVDTNLSGDDFVIGAYSTPGAGNNSPPDTCGGPESGLVINELMANPEGADTDAEWIELYNAGTEAIDLQGWAVQAGSSSYSSAASATFGTPADTGDPTDIGIASAILQPGDFLLVGGALVSDVDIVISLGMGNASDSDAVRVVDCLGFPADTVIYGANNANEWTDDTGVIATSMAPIPVEGASLQRVEEGYDTDQSGADFAVQGTPSPGTNNEPLEPVVCVPSSGSVVINEFLPDPDGTDDGLEFVELYNNGDAPAAVAGWSISAGTSDFEGIDINMPGGALIPANGYYLIAGALVENADLTLGFSLGNASSSGDGLRLFDCEGTAIDTVVYGPDNSDGLPDDKGGTAEAAGDPGSNESLARVEDGVDTNEIADWKILVLPTPGESNLRESGGGSDDLIRSGCGCGSSPSSDAPDGSEPNEGGCSTVPSPAGPIA